MGGTDRWLKIPLDLSKSPVTFAVQATAFVKKKPRTAFHGVLKHNAQSKLSTVDLFGTYQWRIRSPDADPFMVIQPAR